MDEPKQKFNVLFVSAECVPFCARGGVADMCYALPKYLNKNDDLDVRVVLPMYSKIPTEFSENFKLVGERNVELTWRNEYCGVHEYEYNGITYYFIDNKRYFDRPELFGYDDDVERFSYFSKAVLDMLPMINFFPDVIHTNDWQSGMVCTFLKVLAWQNPKYEHIKTVLNIHNLNYQGKADFKVVHDLLGVEDKFAYLFDYYGGANLMKASILCADRIVAVSETYANEIQNTDKGSGLQDVLQSVSYKLSGIINGIDYEYYDPENDTDIFANFSVDKLSCRTENKLKLQETLGLPVDENIPMYGFVGYMAAHKGMELLSQIMDRLIQEKNVQFVAVGGGPTQYEDFMRRLNEIYPNNVKVSFGYSSKLAKKIYAGTDFLFNVSSNEPCGLCPLIANRYGALPIVYQTGGLKDNFSDFKYTNGNGYVLKNYDSNSFYDLLERTLHDFENKEKIENYRKTGMAQDFDIQECADKYTELYYDM